jgi:hypothetical protein
VPVDLHQRLSEFSYGYGVTRQVECLLASVGLRPTPFLPSLLDEARLGFDVRFDRSGTLLLLQFKLGVALQRFRRSDSSTLPPISDKPFWRFNVDTAEPEGQYDLLFKAEQDGNEVFYVAPRFTSWNDYSSAFENGEVLERSVLIRPSEIDSKLGANGEPDGMHRVVYDGSRVYVCSKPLEVDEVRPSVLAHQVLGHISSRDERMDNVLKRALESFNRRREIRMPSHKEEEPDAEAFEVAAPSELPSDRMAPSPEQLAAARQLRLAAFRHKAQSEADAFFAAVGFEAWAAGSQLIAVTAGG